MPLPVQRRLEWSTLIMGGLLGLQHILVCKARVYILGFRLAKAVAVSRF